MANDHQIAVKLLEARTIGDVCQYEDCKDAAVGAGVFCQPDHRNCVVLDVCERHKGDAPDWQKDAGAYQA